MTLATGTQACKECDMVFDAKWQLNRHIADSHSKVVYACSFCTKSYPRKPSLNRHMRTHHKKEQAHMSAANIECGTCIPKKNTALIEHSGIQRGAQHVKIEATALSKSAQLAIDMEELSAELRISEIADLVGLADIGRLSLASIMSDSDTFHSHSRMSTSRSSVMDRTSLFSLFEDMAEDRTSHGSVLGLLTRGSEICELSMVAEIMGEDAHGMAPSKYLSTDDDQQDYSQRHAFIGRTQLLTKQLPEDDYENKLAQSLRTSMRVSINPSPPKRMARCP